MSFISDNENQRVEENSMDTERDKPQDFDRPAGKEERAAAARSASRSRSRSPRRHERRSRSRSPPRRGGGGGPTNRDTPQPSNVLGVFGLSFRTRQSDLEDLFGKFGRLERVNLVMDKYRDASRGFGFIYFEKQEDATAAKEAMNDAMVDERRIRVDYSLTLKAHESTPGFYAGRPTRRDDRRDDRRGGSRRSRSRSPYQRRDRRSRSRSRSPAPYGGGGARRTGGGRSPYAGGGGGRRRSPSPYARRRSPSPYRR